MTHTPVWSMKFVASFFLGTALVLGGCKQAPAPAAGVRNSDGSITNADGSTTNPDGSVTYPAGSNRAQRESHPTPAQQTQQPQQQAAAPVERAAPAPPVARVIPSGTPVRILTGGILSASRNDVGDPFEGSLAAPIEVNGAHFFERGTRVTGTVTASKHKGRFKGAGDLGIELTSIGGVRVSTTDYEAVAKGKGKRTGGFIGGGAGLGALIGGLAGGGKGALIGGLAGAGAGTAGAAYTGSRDVVIPAETRITFRTTAPITLK